MTIQDDSVVTIAYTLTDEEGELIDSSEESGEIEYLHGHGNIVAGLERALSGRKIGESFEVQVEPEDGYGEYDDDLVMEVPRANMPDDVELELGMDFQIELEDGEPQVVSVVEIEDDTVTLDGNHPLAGELLNFSVTVRGIRPATAEELEHGHAHGEHGHEE